jgi:hypothetical protein
MNMHNAKTFQVIVHPSKFMSLAPGSVNCFALYRAGQRWTVPQCHSLVPTGQTNHTSVPRCTEPPRARLVTDSEVSFVFVLEVMIACPGSLSKNVDHLRICFQLHPVIFANSHYGSSGFCVMITFVFSAHSRVEIPAKKAITGPKSFFLEINSHGSFFLYNELSRLLTSTLHDVVLLSPDLWFFFPMFLRSCALTVRARVRPFQRQLVQMFSETAWQHSPVLLVRKVYSSHNEKSRTGMTSISTCCGDRTKK